MPTEKPRTPGPWAWKESRSDGPVLNSETGIFLWGWGAQDASGIDVEPADARLIAKAPELVEALEAFAACAVVFDTTTAPSPRRDEDQIFTWRGPYGERELTVGHLRTARTLLAELKGESGA